MRASVRFLRIVALLIPAAAAGLMAFGCNDSNDVTAPGMGAVANVSGSWSGQYESDAPQICASGTATATLTQDGDRVSGPFKAPGCGISGNFKGRVSGNVLTGAVNMLGCPGGSVTGRLEG